MSAIRFGPSAPVAPADQGTPKLVWVVWALLMVNTLGFVQSVHTIVPFPHPMAQVITMGSLLGAFVIALALNPRVRLRPSVYLLLLSLLLLVSLVASLRMESGVGALVRCLRLTVFLATLWLLTPWWRGDLTFARYHIRVLGAVLLVVLLGLAVSPGTAMSGPPGGRLVGALWPIPAPQVGQYGAVVAGLAVMLWLSRSMHGRTAAWIALPAVGIMLLSHTRTAIIALAVALIGAGLSLTLSNARARRALAVGAVLAGLVAGFLGSVVQDWLARGQDADQLASLTGRQKVWDLLLAQDRSLDHQLLGVGLTDKSFHGLAIDSSWLSIYQEQGFVGIALVAAILLGLLVAAIWRPPGPARACAIFLILYCIVASYTEVGLGDASPYLLHLAVAAALLAQKDSRADNVTTPAGVP